MASNYISSGPYAFKLCEPPRLTIPPPAVEYVRNRPSFRIPGVQAYAYRDEFGDPDFLRPLTSHECSLNHRMLEWKYEERRNAQAILPFLYLGPSSAAQDKKFLRTAGITCLMAVRSDESLRAKLVTKLDAGEEVGLETAVLIASSPLQIIGQLPAAIKKINEHLQRSVTHSQLSTLSPNLVTGKVLVFCENGNDRSSAVVLAYLMAMYNLSAVEAIQAVQSQRFCITAEESMKQMLLQFQELLRAKRDVNACSGTPRTHIGLSSVSRKRGYNDENDTDEGQEWASVDSSDSSEAARTEWAPFKDHAK